MGYDMLKWVLTQRQRCDLELLLNGGFDPVFNFISQADYENILTHCRLVNNHLFPIPVNLDVSEAFAKQVSIGDKIGLHDSDNMLLAYMTITDKWKPNKYTEIEKVYGTKDISHPGVNYILNMAGEWYLGGKLEAVKLPQHYDFLELRHTPKTLKQTFAKLGWSKIVGFQTRNPLHRAHLELTLRAANHIDGNVLLHPVVGITKPGDIDYFTRVRCYSKLLEYYPDKNAMLSLLPLAMRLAGPRSALWHALIRKNYGCTHFIIGRDHAGPGKDKNNQPFYPPYAAQEFVKSYEKEIGIHILTFSEMVYVKERNKYCQVNEIKQNETQLNISGTELRNLLLTNKPIPSWFSFPEVIQELKRAYPPKSKRGFTIFFTGLSGSGKSTLARLLMIKLMSFGRTNISFLDGDIIRYNLNFDLGFTKEDRNLNISRMGFIAGEITKVGGVALCSAIAPYAEARNQNRTLISQYGSYIEIYVKASVEECTKRDTKGLYQKALKGEITNLTGVNDPYEAPTNPELVINTDKQSPEQSLNIIIEYLKDEGFIDGMEMNGQAHSEIAETHAE